MIKKQFVRNVLPSVLAFAFSGVYAIVDGWFVGRNIGDAGLAAINIAYPIVALIQAIGTGLGMGSAIQIAICRGQGDKKAEKEYFGNMVLLLVGACILATVLLGMTYIPILKLFGAEALILEYASSYIRIIIFGASFQILSTGLLPVIRNYNGALIAMLSMIFGFVANVLLDWLLVSVYSYGLAGAAVATIIGQMLTVFPCLVYLTVKKIWKGAVLTPLKQVMRKIFEVGVSPFGLTLSPNIVIIIINRGALAYGGAEAVACYAVVSYVVCVIQLLLQGIGDGSQPLIGRYFGAGDMSSVFQVRRLAYRLAIATAVICMAGIYLLRGVIPDFFGTSSQVAKDVADTLVIFITGFLFAAFLRITTAYFYAIKKNVHAYVLIYGEPLLLAILVAFIMPKIFGLSGVWMAVPAAQICLTAAGFVLLKKEGRVKKKEHLTFLRENTNIDA